MKKKREMTKNIAALVISLHFLAYSGVNASAQCDQCALPVEGKISLIYSGGVVDSLPEDTQIRKLAEFKQYIYAPPDLSGEVHTGLFKKWALVEVASTENVYAAMVAIAKDGSNTRIF